jgi:hypothetical protein
VGEYVSIRKADEAHAQEIREQKQTTDDQKQAIENLKATIQTNEVRNAGQLGYMTAKLE